MRKFLIGAGLSTLLLTGCWGSAASVIPAETESSSSAITQWVTYEGTVEKLGVSMFMEGTHILVMSDGQTALLESDTVVLDDYVDAKVRITGLARLTVEEGGIIVDVDGIERVLSDDKPSVLEESSSTSEASSELSSSAPSSSSQMVSSAAPVSSRAAAVSSHPAPVQTSSVSTVSDETPVSTNDSVKAMSKAKVDTANFNQKYCTTHIGFCIPVHRNWFYVSFGANVSPSLWHVELSDKEIENPGDGAISVDLMSGEASATTIERDGKTVAMAQWTGNRHFEISGDPSLKASLEYIAQNLSTAE
jgi:hypothetical protein